MHLTRDLLHAAASGALSPDRLLRLMEAHLANVCPTCRQELEQFRNEVARGDLYAQIFTGLTRWITDQKSDWRRQEQASHRTAEVLLAIPAAERLEAVTSDPEAFRGAFLAERMLEATRACLPGNPAEAFANAQIAEMAAAPARAQHPELIALAIAHQANARRAGGHLDEADPLFAAARDLLEDATDTLAIAEIDSLEGSLRMDQRRFKQAETLISRAAVLYQVLQDSKRRAHCLIQLGYAHYLADILPEATESTRQALSLLDPKEDSALYLCGRHNLTIFLCAAGEFQEARDTLAYDADLYEAHPDPWTQLRLLWVQGKIARGLGELEAAEDLFIQARDGFAATQMGYDVALVSLDLALIYAEEHRLDAMTTLAGEMITAFQAYELHREAMAALLLFQQTAAKNAVTIGFIERLTAYLEAARSNPKLRFEGG